MGADSTAVFSHYTLAYLDFWKWYLGAKCDRLQNCYQCRCMNCHGNLIVVFVNLDPFFFSSSIRISKVFVRYVPVISY
jgi:hypothetical protein